MKFLFNLQLFGGGGGKGGSKQSSSSSYEMSPYEKQLAQYAVDYGEQASPISSSLLDTFNTLTTDNYGLQNLDYSGMNDTAQSQITDAQSTISGLVNGELPSAYTENMTEALKSGVTNTVGSTINDLASRGVINSSVTNKALNDIESNVANTMAQQYSNNISQVANLANSQISNAGAGMDLTAQAQNYALQPASNALNFSTTLQNAAVTSPLSAMRGTGTTSSSSSTGGSSLGQNLATAAQMYMLFS